MGCRERNLRLKGMQGKKPWVKYEDDIIKGISKTRARNGKLLKQERGSMHG
jgi:hypothetical protein